MPNETTNPESTSKFESGKEHARQAAEDLRGAAEAKARELRATAEAKARELRSVAENKANEYRHRAEQVYDEARTRVYSLREETEAYVRENPMRAVLTALGVGFLIGLIARK